MFYNLYIRHTNIFYHQKRSGTHNRRHNLTINRRGHLNGTGLPSTKTNPFHKGDRKCTCSNSISYGRTRNQSCHPRRKNGCFGWTTSHMSKERECYFYKIVTCTRFIKQSTKKDKKENKTG